MTDQELRKIVGRTANLAWTNDIYIDEFKGLHWVKITKWVPWVMPDLTYFIWQMIKRESIHPTAAAAIPKHIMDYIKKNKSKPILDNFGVVKGYGKLPF